MTDWVDVQVKRIHPAVLSFNLVVESHGCFIAGGYARWACSWHDHSALPKDIDIICPSKRKLENLRARFKNSSGYSEIRDGEFSYTFQDNTGAVDREIQLLKPYQGEDLRECLDKIDLSVCRIALTSHETAIADSRFVSDDRDLKVTVCHIDESMMINTLIRLTRYAHKGYEVDPKDVRRIVEAIQANPLEVKKVEARVEPTVDQWGLS